MFGPGMLGTLVVLWMVSVAAWEPSLFILTLALLVAAGLSRLWERHCLTGVEYRRRFSRHEAYFGEEVQMEIEIVNRKLLPLSWLEIEDEISQDLPPARVRVYPSHKWGRAILANLLAFRPYERVRRRYTIPCLYRGEHRFGPVRLRSGDLFGFTASEQLLEMNDTLVVYPRVLPLARLGLPARQPLGDISVRSWIFEDASRIAGAREYRGGESRRRIHWPASARAQHLQVKVYEATTSHKLAVFLNLSTDVDRWWSYKYDPDLLELGISTAASIAVWGLEQGYQVGVYTNGLHRWSRGDAVVKPGRDAGQLERILLALGGLQPLATMSLELLLARESPRLPYGATVVVVTPALTPSVASKVVEMQSRSHAVISVLTDRPSAGASYHGLVLRHVSPPESWRKMSALSVLESGPDADGSDGPSTEGAR